MDWKKANIGLRHLSLPYEKGGLQCTDISKVSASLLISWMSSLLNGPWQNLFCDTVSVDKKTAV